MQGSLEQGSSRIGVCGGPVGWGGGRGQTLELEHPRSCAKVTAWYQGRLLICEMEAY